MFKKTTTFETVKFTRNDEKIVNLFKIDDKYAVVLIDRETNAILWHKNDMRLDEADIVYNKTVFENGLADVPVQFAVKG